MKNLFNNISQEEKNRVLEMHSGNKNVISEQSIGGAIDWVKNKMYPDSPANNHKLRATDAKLFKSMMNDIEGDGVSIIKETPNQLVIDGVTGTWTITFTK